MNTATAANNDHTPYPAPIVAEDLLGEGHTFLCNNLSL